MSNGSGNLKGMLKKEATAQKNLRKKCSNVKQLTKDGLTSKKQDYLKRCAYNAPNLQISSLAQFHPKYKRSTEKFLK
jgi:hypothetical protein